MVLKSRQTTSTKKKSSLGAAIDGVSPFVFILFGVLFGYFLSKARATDCNTVIDMFLFKDFQLYGVIVVAVATVFGGLFLLKRSARPTRSGEKLDWIRPAVEPRRVLGGFLLGAGWALAGTCPGTSLTQLGEGKLIALFTVAGIFLGVWVYERYMPASDEEVC